jgi:hypothetical protein
MQRGRSFSDTFGPYSVWKSFFGNSLFSRLSVFGFKDRPGTPHQWAYPEVNNGARCPTSFIGDFVLLRRFGSAVSRRFATYTGGSGYFWRFSLLLLLLLFICCYYSHDVV